MKQLQGEGCRVTPSVAPARPHTAPAATPTPGGPARYHEKLIPNAFAVRRRDSAREAGPLGLGAAAGLRVEERGWPGDPRSRKAAGRGRQKSDLRAEKEHGGRADPGGRGRHLGTSGRNQGMGGQTPEERTTLGSRDPTEETGQHLGGVDRAQGAGTGLRGRRLGGNQLRGFDRI